MTKDFFRSSALEFKLDLPYIDSTEDEDANVRKSIPPLRQDVGVLGIPTKPPTKAWLHLFAPPPQERNPDTKTPPPPPFRNTPRIVVVAFSFLVVFFFPKGTHAPLFCSPIGWNDSCIWTRDERQKGAQKRNTFSSTESLSPNWVRRDKRRASFVLSLSFVYLSWSFVYVVSFSLSLGKIEPIGGTLNLSIDA